MSTQRRHSRGGRISVCVAGSFPLWFERDDGVAPIIALQRLGLVRPIDECPGAGSFIWRG